MLALSCSTAPELMAMLPAYVPAPKLPVPLSVKVPALTVVLPP